VSRVVDASTLQQTEHTRLAYFYCRRDEESRRKAQTVLQSFVKQLASAYKEGTDQSDKLHAGLLKLYEEKEHSGFSSAAVSITEAISLLHDLIGSCSRTILVLDALDECNEVDRSTLIDAFNELRQTSSCVKIFISSRRSDDIVRQLSQETYVAIEASDNQDDIGLFVKDALKMDRERRCKLHLRPFSESLSTEITKVIFEKSQGM
jgi:ankyrin repeat domain-containing protein 50